MTRTPMNLKKPTTMKGTLTTLTALAFWTLASLTAFAQDEKYGDTEEQQIACKEGLSVYKSYKKQKNYDEAYIQWRKACEVCPEDASEGLYADGTTFISRQLRQVDETDARHAVLVDSLLYLHDKRMELYPSTKRSPNNRCEILGRKASDYYKYFGDNHQEANAMFKESLDCLGAESSITTLYQYYTSSFYTLTRSLKGDSLAQTQMRAQMLTDYLTLMEYVDEGVARAEAAGDAKDVENYEKAKGNIETVFVAIADCGDMVPVLAASVEANPDDLDLKTKVLRLLNKKECTDNDLFLPVATAVYAVEPSAPAAYAIGIGFAKNSQLDSSFAYMEDAVNRCGDCSDKTTYLLKTGQIASALGRSITAKQYARQVLDLDGDNADAYMLIGDAIAGSSSACDDGALGARSVYWVASDYYARASRLDAEVADLAGRKMANMAKQFPTVDDIFTYGKTAGGSFTVGNKPGCPCSGETTTIRVR
jgi:tetratricopeptide (TPR) repeat protein